MRLSLRVSYLDGSAVDVVTSAADLVRFEEAFSRSIAKLETELRFTDLAWLAWHALKRQGKTGLDFDAWIDTLDSVEFGSPEEAEIVPLESPQPTG